MAKADRPCVQEHPLQLQCRTRRGRRVGSARSRRTCSSPTIGKPTCARCTRIWWVRPVFSSASSSENDTVAMAQVEHRVRGQTLVLVDRDATLAATRRHPLRQRQPDVLPIIDPVTRNQRKVQLLDLSLAQLLMQAEQGPPRLGQQQQSRGLPIEPVRQFEKGWFGRAARTISISPWAMPLPPWAASPAGLSTAIRCSSSNSTGGIRPRSGGGGAAATRIGGIRTWSPSARRWSDRGTRLVHPHLAAAHDPVHVALRHPLARRSRKVVEALTRQPPPRPSRS
jgi:hypothetical protein